MNVTKFAIPEIIFGQDCLTYVGPCARRNGGKRILLVSDQGVEEAGWVEKVIDAFDDEGLSWVYYNTVDSNPRDFQIRRGARFYQRQRADVIVALGGGSPMDTAKGIALIASNGGEIRDYEGANRIQRPLPPMLCIPTTAGSGADISQFAIITDVERQVKMAIISRTLVPNITLIDPTFLQSKPEWLIIASAIDALSHAVEAYVSSISSPFTEMTDLIEKSGLQVAVFDETVPNPTDNNVHDGVEFYKKNNCDSLITLGGGSSHDCGKGVGLVISNGGKIHDFKGIDKSTKPMPPYLAINTTAGTASEMTRFCIITDTSRKVKMAIVDWRVTPNMAIDDPLLMMGMPPGLTAATGMDALTHAVEAYVSLAATPMTDACALKAIEIIGQSLRPAVANGQDIQAREDMCYAQYLAGMAFRVCHKINAT